MNPHAEYPKCRIGGLRFNVPSMRFGAILIPIFDSGFGFQIDADPGSVAEAGKLYSLGRVRLSGCDLGDKAGMAVLMHICR